MNSITVVIPTQPFAWHKYFANEQNGNNCYLKQALIDAGYINVIVHAYGITDIDGTKYKPTKTFTYNTVREELNTGKSISVTLVPDTDTDPNIRYG